MDSLKQKLSELEDQVSSIKDPSLKKIAFEKLLETNLGGANLSRKRSSHGHSSKRTQKSKSGRKPTNPYYSENQIREEVKHLNVVVMLSGFPKFKDCKSKMDSVMWILQFAKEKKVDGLNNHEIAYILTKHLFKQTKYTTVNNIRKKAKEGFVIKEPGTELWRITPDGADYLKSLSSSNNN